VERVLDVPQIAEFHVAHRDAHADALPRRRSGACGASVDRLASRVANVVIRRATERGERGLGVPHGPGSGGVEVF
jgi:hypothetical protein